MKHLRLFIFISFTFLLALNSSLAQDGWVKYKADAVLSFSVDVPGDLQFESNEITTAIGKLTTQTYSLEGGEDDPNYLYLINIVEYPTGTFPEDSLDLIDEFLISSIESTIHKVRGELIYSSEIENGVNGVGKLFRIKHNDDQLVIKGKSFIKKGVFVSIQVFTYQNRSLNDEMDYFLDSFKSTF